MPEPISDVPEGRTTNWRRQFMVVVLAIYWPAIFVATHVPHGPNLSVPGGDKTLHFAAYCVLSILVGTVCVTTRNAAQDRSGFYRPFPVVGALLMTMIYAAIDEVTQPIVGRICDSVDWMADVAGCAVGVIIVDKVIDRGPMIVVVQNPVKRSPDCVSD